MHTLTVGDSREFDSFGGEAYCGKEEPGASLALYTCNV
jgi:hypothetical protein